MNCSSIENTYRNQHFLTKDDLPASFSPIICKNQSFINTLNIAARVAPTNSSVAIYGESGTGKELIAEAIHYASKRCHGPLVKINCAAIPESLFESELFGYEKGAFTGAKNTGKAGKFELANHGTIFLDEIGELPMNMQVKLLRVLQEKEIERIGGSERIKVDFRVVTATNKNLEAMVAEGTFREDLFYRLNVIPLSVPPLRERKEDIIELVHLFLDNLKDMYERNVYISQEAQLALMNYEWPGNVRQLKNLIEQIYILCPSDTIELSNLPSYLTYQPKQNIQKSNISYKLSDLIEKTEKEAIQAALNLVNNNKTQAIQILGISRRCFYQKLEKYQITA